MNTRVWSQGARKFAPLGLLLAALSGCGYGRSAFYGTYRVGEFEIPRTDEKVLVVAIGGWAVNILGSEKGGFAKAVSDQLDADHLKVFSRSEGDKAPAYVATRVWAAMASKREMILVIIANSMGNNKVWDHLAGVGNMQGIKAVVWIMLDASALDPDYPFRPENAGDGTPKIPQGFSAVVNVFSKGPWQGRKLCPSDLLDPNTVVRDIPSGSRHCSIASPQMARIVSREVLSCLEDTGVVAKRTKPPLPSKIATTSTRPNPMGKPLTQPKPHALPHSAGAFCVP